MLRATSSSGLEDVSYGCWKGTCHMAPPSHQLSALLHSNWAGLIGLSRQTRGSPVSEYCGIRSPKQEVRGPKKSLQGPDLLVSEPCSLVEAATCHGCATCFRAHGALPGMNSKSPKRNHTFNFNKGHCLCTLQQEGVKGTPER